jgi:hypothetical protein
MNIRRATGSCLGRLSVLGLWLALVAAFPAAAQVSPLTIQSIFFNQASNAHPGNYLAAEAGGVYTDNATLLPGGSGSAIALIGLIGDASRDGTRFDYRLDSDLALEKYLGGGGDFDKVQPAGYFDGLANLKIVPGTFSWTARETFSQIQIDPFGPPSPDNLENLNYITTGPRFTLRPTLRTTITLNATYSYIDSSSENADYINVDNHRYQSDLTIERAFSSVSSAYLTGSYQKVDFVDHIDNTDFSISEGALGYRLGNGRTALDLSGGDTKVQAGTEDFSGGTYAVSLSRVLTPNQRLVLTAVKALTDTASLFRQGLNQSVPGLVPDRFATADPFTNREYGADWRFQASRTSIDLGVLAFSQQYELDPQFNRHVKLVSALVARQMSPALNWDLGIRYGRENFVGSFSQNTSSEITNLRWQVGGLLSLRFFFAHTSVGNPDGYSVNQVGVIASYALIEGGQHGAVNAAEPDATAPNPALLPTSPMSMQPPLQ